MHDHSEILIDLALAEDIGAGDVTARYFIPAEKRACAFVAVRKQGVLSGVGTAARVFQKVDPDLTVEILIEDGNQVAAGALIIRIEGSARSILTAERTALNFLQRLSGVASLTALYVEQVKGTKARILDTRKTTPGYRALEKKAVLDGGGTNHRIGLYDRAMVKDNHLVSEGGIPAIQASILQLKTEKPSVEVELEADHLDQVRAFLTLQGVDYLLLDNMTLPQLREAVSLRGSRAKPLLEASGGITLDTLREIAATGVDFISVGALTHSAPALDINMKISRPGQSPA
jgi:nicotinate-nucleotide pyrophosphorylase (carboxylating)